MGFLYYSSGNYIYEESDGEGDEFEGTEFEHFSTEFQKELKSDRTYKIKRDTLIFTFMVYGYLRCPLNRRPFSTKEILSLLKISDAYDPEMSKIVRSYYSNYCDIESRKKQLHSIKCDWEQLKNAFIYILVISLLLIGWNDTNQKLPSECNKNIDIIHTHLNCLPYYISLRNMPCYQEVKKLGIYGNFCNSGYTIENVFKELENTDLCDLSRHGKELLSTSMFYLKNFFGYKKPQLDQLLSNI